MDIIKTQNFGIQAADFFLEKLRIKNDPIVTLPSGNTPLPFYAALRERKDIPSFTYLQLDEYIGLSEDDPKCFKNWIAREILNPINLPDQKRITFDSSPTFPEEAALDMQEWFADNGPIDIAVLGIGANGHIGFNEPPSGPLDSIRMISLAKETQKANAAYWDDGVVPLSAVTLGLFEILQSTHIILLATSAEKNRALRQAFLEKPSPHCPASYLQKHKNVTLIGDKDALNGL